MKAEKNCGSGAGLEKLPVTGGKDIQRKPDPGTVTSEVKIYPLDGPLEKQLIDFYNEHEFGK